MEKRMMRQGFTLVELMVVIAIIVLLIALLAPALDRAVYQAELAVCAARLRGVAHAVVIYAGDHRRSYPYRAIPESGAHINRIAHGNNTSLDDRIRLRRYLPINPTLLDPLAGKVNLETLVPNSEVYASYNLFFCVRFQGRGAKGMYKLGDRWTWENYDDPAQPRRFSLNYLAADRDRFLGLAERLENSHPDSQGMTVLAEWQENEYAPIVPGAPAGNRLYTWSGWFMLGQISRGTVDMNFACDDASVQRSDGVGWDEWMEDDRTGRIPSLTNPSSYADSKAAPGYFDQVPLR